MIVVPAIDLLDGKVVRLQQGDYTKSSVYGDDPLELANKLEHQGFRHLHLVDLSGAREGKIIHGDLVKKITKETKLMVDFGGGIRSDADVEWLLDAGVNQINCGSIAVKNPETVIGWLQRFGPDKIMLSADAKDNKVAVSGWTESTAMTISELIKKFLPYGLQYVTCTDIGRDGMLTGPAMDWYRALLAEFDGLKLIASGGIRSAEDLIGLRAGGLYGAVTGKALLEGQINANELKELSLLW